MVMADMFSSHLIWKALLVPLWSRSWQKHPMSSASCSMSVRRAESLLLCEEKERR